MHDVRRETGKTKFFLHLSISLSLLQNKTDNFSTMYPPSRQVAGEDHVGERERNGYYYPIIRHSYTWRRKNTWGREKRRFTLKNYQGKREKVIKVIRQSLLLSMAFWCDAIFKQGSRLRNKEGLCHLSLVPSLEWQGQQVDSERRCDSSPWWQSDGEIWKKRQCRLKSILTCLRC